MKEQMGRTWGKRNAYKILFGKPEEIKPPATPRHLY
jgi:hypothetical protein